ncbi:Coenzyme F420 hydrogenase/dehydrogenase, beta subunit C-terminal domain [Hydrocarboniphaga sp.]|uniref:Coenzyme F420 hydrogenase/dehydrogenase, beta subunit C-terminal domain n=1 Tax=Hydrocarboniphaga sp. TaxID=2033016 RepID=UPI002ABACAAA|nr:Coenzyme F420 hydrogenase/dehydrogenase, beta subunit C-terminal domain [Hydrocarboniphaga sp.]MDZ4078358.1 Coenzyme F420 hydrogenase/dehydrogenase, beta subunit C-terminal domain [Hydrocarboniphaga sp.]
MCESLFGTNKIEVKIDSTGFFRPQEKNKLSSAESKIFDLTCPGLNASHPGSVASHHPTWGPISSIQIAAAADDSIRQIGSSGGVLSALQVYLLENGIVDYIISTEVTSNDPIGTTVSVCRNRSDVLRAAGSRYSPSAPLRTISSFLEQDGKFAFVGKPCDVAALRRLGEVDARVKDKVAIMLSFMCAGVPSRHSTNRLVESLGLSSENLATFRYRGDGWPGLTKAVSKSGEVRTMTYEQSWGKYLGPNVQWRCKICPDGTGELADIVCADAWHLADEENPDFSERPGRSFVIARSSYGKTVLSDCESSNYLGSFEKSSLDYLGKIQAHQAYRRHTMLARHLAIASRFKRATKFNLISLIRAARNSNLLSQVRAFGGTIKRLPRI